MGCPGIYYTRMMQKLCYAFNCWEDHAKAKELYDTWDDNVLEEEINRHREKMNVARFAFDAGRAAEIVNAEADEEGCDAFNACIGGFNQFYYFICGEEEDEDGE